MAYAWTTQNWSEWLSASNMAFPLSSLPSTDCTNGFLRDENAEITATGFRHRSTPPNRIVFATSGWTGRAERA